MPTLSLTTEGKVQSETKNQWQLQGISKWPRARDERLHHRASEMQPEAKATGSPWPGSFHLNAEGAQEKLREGFISSRTKGTCGILVPALPLTVSPWASHFACLGLSFLIFKQNHTNISYRSQAHFHPLNSLFLNTQKILWPGKGLHFHYRKRLAMHRQKQEAS